MNKEELELVLDMCQHPGWKIVIKDAEQRMEALQSGALFNCQTEKDLVETKAEFVVLMRMVRTEETVKQALQTMEEEEISEY